MNEIKNRQKFRPFTSSVLEEHTRYLIFRKSQFNKFTETPCKFPDKYPIVHIDNTSRVQTVSKDDNIGYYNLTKGSTKKQSPMVLNTSLNINQPIVNSYQDEAREEIWRKVYNPDKKKVKERYIIEIKYLDDKVEELDISTDDIEWSMEQYQRNRTPFNWKIKYHYI